MTGSRRILTLSRAGLFGALGLMLVGVACGGGSSPAAPDGGAAGTGGYVNLPGTPVQLCNRLVKTICTRLSACPGVLTDPTTFVQADCELKDNVAAGCDRATATTFPDCIKDTTTISCAGLFSSAGDLVLPPSCDDPLTIDPSDAQTKCGQLSIADCSHLATCAGVAVTQANLQDCLDFDNTGFGCAFAVSVGASYDQCKLDIANSGCDGTDAGAGPPLPTSCQTAITIAQ